MLKERAFLIALSNGIFEKLKERGRLSPLILGKNKKIVRTNSDGWLITLGRLHRYNCYAEIWLDKFTRHESRRIQYTISSYTKDSKLNYIEKKARKVFGQPVQIASKYEEDDRGTVQMPKYFAKAKFGKIVFESYRESKESFYGVYELDKRGFTQNELKRLIQRATDFFIDIIEILASVRVENQEIYAQVENRQKVRIHLYRERRSLFATLRKQLDDYRCAICKFKFTEMYGKLGDNVAEAHHILPLSSNNKERKIRIEHLLTVCANCHRILHKMQGKPDDIESLKSIVRKQTGK